MYNYLIYFNEHQRSNLVKALELFKLSHSINYFFGKIQFENDECIDVSFSELNERPVCFVYGIELEDEFRLHDFLRALRFRFASL